MDYNSKGWQSFRRRVPHTARYALALILLALMLPFVAALHAFFGTERTRMDMANHLREILDNRPWGKK